MHTKESTPPVENREMHSKRSRNSLWEAFSEISCRFPAAIAAMHQDSSITYEELYSLSLKIKRHLCAVGVDERACLAIKMPKDIFLLAHMLAGWAQAGSLLLIETEISPEELSQKLDKSRATWLISDDFSDLRGLSDICINILPAYGSDKDLSSSRAYCTCEVEISEQAEPRAGTLILFTSGTTGIAKCLALPHEGILKIVQALIRHYGLDTQSRLGWTASLSFDSAIAEPALALLSGASLVIPKQDRHLTGRELEEFLTDRCITHLIITPSVLETAIPENIPAGIVIALVGEPFSESTVERWGRNHVLYNAYGPSEASICATISGPLVPGEPVSVGRPLPGVTIEIVDSHRKVLPTGQLGEIAIGGVGVSGGYLGDIEATTRKFARIFPGGQTFHLTGDVGFIGCEGNLFLQGRKDQQVKVNGRRVDLGEIERALCKHERILQAFASQLECESGKFRLTAFIKLDPRQEIPTVRQLREHTATLLPSFALPSDWYVVESLPRTSNGKLDRKLLFESVSFKLPYGNYSAPEGDLEKRIADLFQNILSVKDIGQHDNFFVLGGTSLDTIRVVDSLRRYFSADISYELFISNATVRQVSDLIKRDAPSSLKRIQQPLLLPATSSYQPVKKTIKFPKSVLITGGTGFLGKGVIEELLNRTEAQIFCAGRHRSQSQLVQTFLEHPGLVDSWGGGWAGRMSPVYFDLDDAESYKIDEVIADVDLVIHCAANVNLAYDFGSLYTANVLATLNLVDRCSVGRPKKFILISSRSAVDPHDTSGYGQTKREAEHIVQEAFTRGLIGTIVRPGRITGHNSLVYVNDSDYITRIIRACLLLGCYPVGLEAYGGVPVNVLAADVVAGCLQDEMEGLVVDVADSDFYIFSEIFSAAEAVGLSVNQVSIDEWLERAVHGNIITRFPDVLAGFQNNWDAILRSCSFSNYKISESNPLVRAECAKHLIASILHGQ